MRNDSDGPAGAGVDQERSPTTDARRLVCEGSSDDTFGVYGAGLDLDHDNCASGRPITFRITASGESMLVVGQYAPGSCAGWLVGIAPDDYDDIGGDCALPEWRMWFTQSDRPYSPALVIEVPLGAAVEYVPPGARR